MGSAQSSQEVQIVQTILAPQMQTYIKSKSSSTKSQPKITYQDLRTRKQNRYSIPKLQKVIAKAHQDQHCKDPIAKKRYFFQIVNFIFEWLRQAMNQGMTLHDAQKKVHQNLVQACKDYPIDQISKIQTTIQNKKPQQLPNLLAGLQNLNKQKFTDRIKQLSIRSKVVSYEFNKQMQLVLEKQGGFKFKGGYKNTGIKAYMRILTKILQDYLDEAKGSTQVYENMDHYYWTPIFIYFNKLIDENIDKLQVTVYDWIRCRVFYRNISELQEAYKRLEKKFGDKIFRVKNRINMNTRDVLINMNYKSEYAEIQLALSYDSSAYDFNHKLYELTRQKLGVAYCCFTILLNEVAEDESNSDGVMTSIGYIKKALLRENVQDDFERLTKQQAQQQWTLVSKLLKEWDVIALQTGVIRGYGFEQQLIDTFYGPQISQMMIIKRKTGDSLIDWLNWMDSNKSVPISSINNSQI